MSDFQSAIAHLLKIEGGYSNRSNDRGGETYAGITYKNHPNWEGWKIVRSKIRENGEIIPELDIMVRNFYRRYYWDAIPADLIGNDRVASFFFDWYVHSGPVAIREVQKITRAEPDGIIGPTTIRAINNYDGSLFASLKSARVRFLKNIVTNDPGQAENLNGWMNRVNSFG